MLHVLPRWGCVHCHSEDVSMNHPEHALWQDPAVSFPICTSEEKIWRFLPMPYRSEHNTVARPFSLAAFSAGRRIPARIAMIAIVMRSSISVNFRDSDSGFICHFLFCLVVFSFSKKFRYEAEKMISFSSGNFRICGTYRPALHPMPVSSIISGP